MDGASPEHCVRIGDYICLYSESAKGFIYSEDTSVRNNGLKVYLGQDYDAFNQISNVHVVSFQILTQNRYKLTKKYRKLREEASRPHSDVSEAALENAKEAAEIEVKDNLTEQKRLMGQPIKYGDIVQLRHVFTSKFLLVSTTETSVVDKNKMLVKLDDYNSKHAQFRIVPRYKVKTEGELVELEDQIVLESVKSIGTFLHVTVQNNNNQNITEVNCGIDKAVFTVIRHFSPKRKDHRETLRGGSVVQLFHKELEAYISAEGIYPNVYNEKAHLRVRKRDERKIKSFLPAKNSCTYWQIVRENSAISGEIFKWGDNFHLLHLTTQLYLSFDEQGSCQFVEEASHSTLFKFYPLLHGPSSPHVQFDGTVRICHLEDGSWINGSADFSYERGINTEGDSLETIHYDPSTLLQLRTSQTREYPDAFILQKVATSDVDLFNYVLGLIPFMREITDMKHADLTLTAIETLKITRTFDELQRRLASNARDDKNRHNILRHTKMVDSLVEFLHAPFSHKDAPHMLKIFRKIYSIFYNIAVANSNSNRLYCARFFGVFKNHLCLENGVGRLCCQAMMELVRNNRTVIDRILPQHVDEILQVFGNQTESYFFDLLGVLCMCDDIAITDNQVQIAESLVLNYKENLFHLVHGKQIGMGNDVFISMDNGEHWLTLAKFAEAEENQTNITFFIKQLQLYNKLCFGQNRRALELLTQSRDLFAWDTAFHILTKSKIPDSMRALVCQLITGLFLQVDSTQSNLSRLQSNNFMFDSIDMKTLNQEDVEQGDREDVYYALKEWVKGFCKNNPRMHGAKPERNDFIKEVLHLITNLIQLNRVQSQKELEYIRGLVMNYIKNGTHITEAAVKTEVGKTQIQVLLQSLELVDIMLAKQFWRRMKFLLGTFKGVQERMQKSKICQLKKPTLGPLLSEDFKSDRIWQNFPLKVKIGMLLKEMSNKSDFVGDVLARTLFALANVEDDALRRKCLSLLNRYYSSKHDLLKTASRTQVIVSASSETIQKEALTCIPHLRKLAKSKVDEDGFTRLCQLLERLLQICRTEGKFDESVSLVQNILVNNGILEVILQLSTQVADIKLEERYNMAEVVSSKSLALLRCLAEGNQWVQDWLHDNLTDFLQGVSTSGSHCALAVMEVFKGRPLLCVKISPQIIRAVVNKCMRDRETAPEWLKLLKSFIKDDNSGIVIKRNQGMIAKALMSNFSETLYPMELTQEERVDILLRSESSGDKLYYVYLVELLAACAEGENEYIESLCQKLLTVSEILTVLNSNDISWETKTVFGKFFVWVYINSAKTLIESGIEELCHDRQIWKHIQMMSAFAKESSQTENIEFVKYMQTAGFHVLKGFFSRMYQEDDYQEESDWLLELLEALEIFCQPYIQYAASNLDIETMAEALQILISKSGVNAPKKILKKFYNKAKRKKFKKEDRIAGSLQKQDLQEMKLNRTFHRFCEHLLYYLNGKNTVAYQRGMLSRKYSNMEYTKTSIDSSVPLGREFQMFVDSFTESGQDVNKLNRLIQQLAASYKLWPEKPPRQQEELDIKCLQILQAHLHNVIVLLPENWEENTHKWKKILEKVKQIQDRLDEFDIVNTILPLMARANPMFGKQVLQLTHSLLFNANSNIQESVYSNFQETKEEKFFLFIRENLQLALLAIKERRHLTAQKEAKKRSEKRFTEAEAEADIDQDGEQDGTLREQGGNNMQYSMMQMKKLGKKKLHVAHAKAFKDLPSGLLHKRTVTLEAEFGDDILKDQSTTHTTDVIMAVLGGLCDGQNKQMQQYLRHQPDNLHSIDLIAKVTELLNGVYTHVNQYSIKICTELFQTLHEMCEGNEENKVSLLNNKIVDHMNFILRKSSFEDCTVQQVCQLRKAMGRLLYSLIEEQGSDAQNTAKEVCQTIAFDGVKHVMVKCYVIAMAHGKEDLFKEKTTLDDFESLDLKVPGIFDGIVKVEKGMDFMIDIGFLYYYIVATMYDINKRLQEKAIHHPVENDAFQFFKSQCKSVEIQKEDKLHKKHFRVKNENLLREEVKETLKWEIDRSSPSSKLRDLLLYSKDILKDIHYQKSIHRVWIVALLAKRWSIWNILCVFLSLVINVFMLVTWSATFTTEDLPENATQIPAESPLYSPRPDILHVTEDQYNTVVLVLGSLHCFCSVMLFLCYLLLYHPTIPTWFIRSFILRAMSGNPFRYVDEDTKSQFAQKASALEVNLFSAATFYYVTTVVFSVLGLLHYEYFFAFHLFGIVNNNQLLKGVIKAITWNGKSLLWVGVLGAVVIYVYALVSFGFFRSAISLEDEMFCNTLAECFVSLIRYGTIGDIADKVHLNGLDMSFVSFGWITLFQVTFFIIFTTIGLNIIFGIIVDTFSEIRDTKWIAEKDMRDLCFICSKDSYEFEHNAQGFHHHVKEDHNMWAYVFYFIYLEENEEKEHTSLDMHVATQLKVDGLDFFPMNCALCLTSSEDDSVEDQIKDMKAKLNVLQKQHAAQTNLLLSIQKKMEPVPTTSTNNTNNRNTGSSRRFQSKPMAGSSRRSHDTFNITGHMTHASVEVPQPSEGEDGEASQSYTSDSEVMATVRLLPTDEESELSSIDNN